MKSLYAAVITAFSFALAGQALAVDGYTVVVGTLIKSQDPAHFNCNGVAEQTHAFGTASCPAGYVATGGSVQCQFPGRNGSNGGGIMLTSRLLQPSDANGNLFQWYGDCCISRSGTVDSFDGISIMCVAASKLHN